MSEQANSSGIESLSNGLRERNAQASKPIGDGEVTSQSLEDKLQVEEGDAADAEKKTFGRTPDGKGELPRSSFRWKLL